MTIDIPTSYRIHYVHQALRPKALATMLYIVVIFVYINVQPGWPNGNGAGLQLIGDIDCTKSRRKEVRVPHLANFFLPPFFS